MRRTALVLLLSAAVSPGAARAADLPADEAAVQAAGLPLDGAGLLAYFEARARGDASPERVAALVARLGSAAPDERTRAAAALVGVGPQAAPKLQQAANDPDGGIAAALARRCLRAVGADSAAVSVAAARLVAARRPTGATAALLAFLPAAEDVDVVEEVKATLAAVAFPGGKPDPALATALTDPSALRRAAAVEILCRGGKPPAGVDLGGVLRDPAPAVRLQAALALAAANDSRGVSTLVALLEELPPEPARAAEDFLLGLAAEKSPRADLGADEAARRKARAAWEAWWKSSEGPGLLDALRKRTFGDAERERAAALVGRLGDDAFDRREEATDELEKLGGVAVRLLRAAETNPDAEVVARARACLERIGKDGFTPLSSADARLIALRKPGGAAAALVAFLPYADDEGLAADVQLALDAVAYPGGRPDPALLQAATDKLPQRRGAAAEALCTGDDPEALSAARRVLADPDASARLQAALALAGARDRAAVPVLAALAGDADEGRAAAAEEYLRRLAGDRLPAALAGPTPSEPAARARRASAWAGWWRGSGDAVALVDRVAPVTAGKARGTTLLVFQVTNSVAELGADGKIRWQMSGLLGPLDAELLPGERLLVAEVNAGRVTERDRKGAVVWEKAVAGYPVGVQRLPNGNTFVAARGQLVEVDRTGREVFALVRPTQDVMSARKLRDGRVVCVTSQGVCLTLDRSGKELKSFPIPTGVQVFGNEILPRGGVLTPVTYQNKVVEYDAEGKQVWEASVPQPVSATRLPNGNTLVAVQQWPARLVELDRSGKTVGETRIPNQPVRVHRN